MAICMQKQDHNPHRMDYRDLVCDGWTERWTVTDWFNIEDGEIAPVVGIFRTQGDAETFVAALVGDTDDDSHDFSIDGPGEY